MTEPERQLIEEVVEALTPAMRKWLPTFSENPTNWIPAGIAKPTRKRMVSVGLLEERTPSSGVGLIVFALTPLGLAVRAATLTKLGSTDE